MRTEEELEALHQWLMTRCSQATLSENEATEVIWRAFGIGVAKERERMLDALRVQVSLLERGEATS